VEIPKRERMINIKNTDKLATLARTTQGYFNSKLAVGKR